MLTVVLSARDEPIFTMPNRYQTPKPNQSVKLPPARIGAKPPKGVKPAKGTPPPIKNAKPTPPELIPQVIAEPTLDDHLEVMTRAIFQAGLSWAFIESRWSTFRPEFGNFAIDAVAAYADYDIERLMTADGVVHSRSKITGTIANALALKALVAEFGSVRAYVETYPTYDALYKDAKKRFAFLGDLSCFYWLFRTGLPVMNFEEWMTRQTADHPRMREMVLLARTQNRSSEAGFTPSTAVAPQSPVTPSETVTPSEVEEQL